MNQRGVLLINLGTPDDPSVASVRRYLREFLLDPRVIDLPVWLRYIFVYGFILPFRSPKSAKAYQAIWTEAGSPLRIHTEGLVQSLSAALGDTYRVVYAMRYGKPSIASAIDSLRSCQRVIIFPLFPQYSSAATGSVMAAVLRLYAKAWNIPELMMVQSFYQDKAFIHAYAEQIKAHLDPNAFLLFSYHSLPKRHLVKGECCALCHELDPCPPCDNQNTFCYRAQCYATSRAIAEQLGLSSRPYSTSFQSRLGRIPWIKPYTDEQLKLLHEQGVDHLALACPSFAADCLETLEEIGLRAKAQWQALGGKSFTLIPCLNEHPLWIKAISQMILSKTGSQAC